MLMEIRLVILQCRSDPNKKLLDKIAEEKLDCKIIIERKDVIYKLDEVKHGIY